MERLVKSGLFILVRTDSSTIPDLPDDAWMLLKEAFANKTGLLETEKKEGSVKKRVSPTLSRYLVALRVA